MILKHGRWAISRGGMAIKEPLEFIIIMWNDAQDKAMLYHQKISLTNQVHLDYEQYACMIH